MGSFSLSVGDRQLRLSLACLSGRVLLLAWHQIGAEEEVVVVV